MRRVLRAYRRRCRGGVPREAAFEGFAHRFGHERPSDGVGRCDRVRVKCGYARRHPVASGEDTELFVGEASQRRGVRSVGVGVCCEKSASGASEGFGAGRFSQGRDRGECRHCLSFHSTTLRLLYKCEALWRSDTPTMAAISRTARPRMRSAAMRAVATKSLVIWPRAYWSEGCFFGHWRSEVTFSLVAGGATRRAVRKHRAPNGALRRATRNLGTLPQNGSESTERQTGIKTYSELRSYVPRSTRVRKHRAPNGALRRQ